MMNRTTQPKRRAFLVLGPESSGTRLVTRCLIAAGCQGDGDHHQAFDRSLDEAGDCIVWRRSMPHGGQWPNLEGMLTKLRERGYEVFVFATLRNQYCTISSQLLATRVKDISEAENVISTALFKVASFVVTNNLRCQYVTYDSLIHDFPSFRLALEMWDLKLEQPPEELRNENTKHTKKEDTI